MIGCKYGRGIIVLGANVLEVVFGEVIQTSGMQGASVPNSPQDNISWKRGNIIIKWTLLVKAPLENPGGGVIGVKNGERKKCLS